MVKNWKKFIESNIFGKSKQDIEDEFNQKLSFSKNYASAMQRQKNAEIREINLKKYEYTKEEINLVSRIKSKSKEIEKEYEFELDFKRFDDLGIPFIDIIEKNAHNGLGFAVYDIKHKIIPDILSYLFILCASITLLVTGGNAVGILIAIPFWLIVLISKETWMGGGDAKLAMGIGLLLGVTKGISALFIASWIGALVGIVLLFMHRKGGTIKRLELPFAPFLILGMYIVLFSGIDIIYVTSFF